MRREIYTKLQEWKRNPDRKPLLLYGARQVGKTYILKEFGKEEFKQLVYVNCDKNEPVKNLFSGNYDIDKIINGLEILYSMKITPGDTLIFFDEVQEIPAILTSLKYFCEYSIKYDITAAGSLLGVHDLKGYPFPVGKVDILYLYPMTFLEFLWGIGEESKGDLLKRNPDEELINSLLPAYTDFLRQYYFTGGMPEAVAKYAATRDTTEVRKIQKAIMEGYYADIAKHAGNDAPKCRQVLDSIPSQLARENKKFIYGAVRKGGRAKEFERGIQWLVDAGIVYRVPRITKAALPLKFYIDTEAFKLFLLDVGLLGAMVEAPPETILVGDKIFSEYKGAFTENYVLTQLKPEEDVVIGYYSKDNSTLEVDFVVQQGNWIFPIEVKAEENVKSKSLHQFINIDNKDSGLKGFRVSMKGFIDQGWMKNIPLAGVRCLLNQK